MRLIRSVEVETTREDHLFYHSRVRPVMWTLALGTSVAILKVGFGARWGYYILAIGLLALILSQRFITAPFRRSNWLVRMNNQGLFIQFRSYLNYHLPSEDITVAFLTFQEIRSARLVRERVAVRSTQGGTSTQTLRFVELELIGDTEMLAKALAAEPAARAPNEKHWYGTSSTLYQDYPVSMPAPSLLRLRWQVVPGVNRFFDALRPWTCIAEPIQTSHDFVHLRGLSKEQQLEYLRELEQRGETITAIYTARRLYGCDLEEATSIIRGTLGPNL